MNNSLSKILFSTKRRQGIAIITTVIVVFCLTGSLLLNIPRTLIDLFNVAINLETNSKILKWNDVIEGFPIMPKAQNLTSTHSYIEYDISASQAEVEAYYVSYYCIINHHGIININSTNHKNKSITFETLYWDIFLNVNYIEDNLSHVYISKLFTG